LCKQVRHGSKIDTLLLQLRVLGLGFLEDGDVGVGVFPEGEEIFVGGERPDAGGIGCCSFAYSDLASFGMGMSGSASFQRAKKRSLRQAHAFEQVDVARVRVKGLKSIFGLYVFHAARPLRVTFFQPLEGMVAVSHQPVVTRHLVG
jgi:hypothetical protein